MPRPLSGYPTPEPVITKAIPAMPPLPIPVGSRPSKNLGGIFRSQIDHVGLAGHILPSNVLPFSQLVNPRNVATPNMQNRPAGLQVPLAGPNLKIPSSLPPGITNNPNFQRLAETIRNTASRFTRTTAGSVVTRSRYGPR